MYSLKLNLQFDSPLKLLFWNFLSVKCYHHKSSFPRKHPGIIRDTFLPIPIPRLHPSTSVQSVLLLQYFSCISIPLYLTLLLDLTTSKNLLNDLPDIIFISLQSILYTTIKIISLNANLKTF